MKTVTYYVKGTTIKTTSYAKAKQMKELNPSITIITKYEECEKEPLTNPHLIELERKRLEMWKAKRK